MFEGRIRNVRQKLLKEGIDAVLISEIWSISYMTGFTNFSLLEREAYIFIGQDFGYIITDVRYKEAVKKEVPHLTFFERGRHKSIADLFKKHRIKIKKLGIEEDNLTVAEYKTLKKYFKTIRHFDLSGLRSIKTKTEIDRIEKACRLGDMAFDYILKKIKIGITEKEIAQNLEKFIKDKGADLSFPPIVAVGKNSSVPHHQTGYSKLTAETRLVLLDFGVKYEHYCSDMSRTIFLGSPDIRQKRMYKAVLTAQQKAVDFINSRAAAGQKLMAAEVDKVARDYIVSQGYPEVPHSLGHGIGLAVHEYPSLSPQSQAILKAGMVFSIEPGIYLPEVGGIRIEDIFVLEKSRLNQLTKSPTPVISVKI